MLIALIQALEPVSGAMFNPAVTLAMMLAEKLGFLKGVAYILTQCIGAILGAGLLSLLLPASLVVGASRGGRRKPR